MGCDWLTLRPGCDGSLQRLTTFTHVEQNICVLHIGGWTRVARHQVIIHLVPLVVGCLDVSIVVSRIGPTSSMGDDTVQRVRGAILSFADYLRQGKAFFVPNGMPNFAPQRRKALEMNGECDWWLMYGKPFRCYHTPLAPETKCY